MLAGFYAHMRVFRGETSFQSFVNAKTGGGRFPFRLSLTPFELQGARAKFYAISKYKKRATRLNGLPEKRYYPFTRSMMAPRLENFCSRFS